MAGSPDEPVTITRRLLRRIGAAVQAIERDRGRQGIAGFNDRHEGEGGGGAFVVDLTSTSGSGTVAAPYVYTAKVEGSTTELGTGLSPIEPRLPFRVTAAATKGLGDYGTDGAFRLIRAFESWTPVQCSGGGS